MIDILKGLGLFSILVFMILVVTATYFLFNYIWFSNAILPVERVYTLFWGLLGSAITGFIGYESAKNEEKRLEQEAKFSAFKRF